MLRLLIGICILGMIQGKAFPKKYKRSYDGNYNYDSLQENFEILRPEYIQNIDPYRQQYTHRYIPNSYQWSYSEHHPMSNPSRQFHEDQSFHNKMKSKHTWHFIDQNHEMPITQYTDELQEHKVSIPFQKFSNEKESEESNEVTQNEFSKVSVKKPHLPVNEYELPIVVDRLTKKQPATQWVEYELPVVEMRPIVKEKPIKGKYVAHIEKPVVVREKPVKQKPVGVKEEPIKMDEYGKQPVTRWVEYELPVVEMRPIVKEKPIKGKPVAYKEKPVVVKEKPVKEKPVVVKEKPVVVKEKPVVVKEKPVVVKEKPIKMNEYGKQPVTQWVEYELPIVEMRPTLKEKPTKGKLVVNKEKPVKEKPVKEKPVEVKKPIKVDEYGLPILDHLANSIDDEKPVVVAALVQKERPFQDEDDEKPVVVAALVQKPMRTGSIVDKKRIPNDSMIKKEDIGNFGIPVEAFEELEIEHEIPGERMLPNENLITKNEFEEAFEDGDSGSALDMEISDDTSRSLESLMGGVRLQERRKFKSCVTPKNESGHCMPFQLCSVINIASNVDELLRNVCIIDDVFFGICCPEFPVETVRVDWGQFLKSDTDTFKDEKPTETGNECGNLPSIIKDGDSWPWMASLIARSSDKIFCGGALITDQYVLTAAHCTIRIPRNHILVRLAHPDSSTSSSQDLEVIEIKRHAGYNPRTMQNDIALLKLSKRVRLGDFRRLICLTDDDEDFVDKSASLLRWKGTLGEIGDVESLPVISNEECQNRMRSVIPDSILCAEPRTVTMCNADSGAPFIISEKEKFKVIGLLTWNRNDCDERFPTIFTRVSSYSRWIQRHTS